jgi:phosphoribosylaminoimidazole (AIR) synthetase
MVVVVSEEDCSEVLLRLKAMGENAYHIGSVESRNDDEAPVQFVGLQ